MDYGICIYYINGYIAGCPFSPLEPDNRISPKLKVLRKSFGSIPRGTSSAFISANLCSSLKNSENAIKKSRTKLSERKSIAFYLLPINEELFIIYSGYLGFLLSISSVS